MAADVAAAAFARVGGSSSSNALARHSTILNFVGPAPVQPANKQTKEEKLASAKECGVSLRQYEEMLETFQLFDADGSGSIDPKEIRTQMRSLGFKVDNTTIYQLISDLDSDGSQSIEFEEFAGLLKELNYAPGASTPSGYSEIFDFMDDIDPKNRDAKIDSSNLRRIANVLGDHVLDAELEVMIKGADRDGKGYVSCQDFYELMIHFSKKIEDDDEEVEEKDVSQLMSGRRFSKERRVSGSARSSSQAGTARRLSRKMSAEGSALMAGELSGAPASPSRRLSRKP